MPTQITLGYRYDALCGWCYGLIPAMRRLVAEHPYIPIDVIPGGLFIGENARPYSALIDHITTAQVMVEAATGRKPGAKFHAMISGPNPPISESSCPNHAVLQMKHLAPERALELAHILQEVHYEDGRDLGSAATYQEVCATYGFPALDTAAITTATAQDPLVAESYARGAELGNYPFPTIFVFDTEGHKIGAIQGIYQPAAFVTEIERYLPPPR